MTTDEVTTAIVAINEDATVEQIAEAMDKLAFIKQFVKDASAMLESRMLEKIEATKADIQIGPKRYYAGTEKQTRCRDNTKAFIALFDATGGDVEAIARDVLRSDCLKPSAAKQLLGEARYEEHFETTVKPVLKDGAPKKQLLCTDERFVKGTSKAVTQENV